MQKKTKIALVVSGALLTAGAATGIAIAERGEKGWRGGHGGYGHHGGHMGKRWGKRGGFGGTITKDDFATRSRERFARFDQNSDGVIDAAEAEAVFKARMDERAERRGKRGRRGMRMFKRFDTDNDGKVTKAEIEERVKRKFARMDLNNDGKITEEDLPPRMRGRGILGGTDEAARGPLMRGGRFGRRGRKGRKFAMLRFADANKDGSVTLDEAVAAATKRFARKDKNGDGVIDQADREARKKEHLDYRVKRFIHRFGPEADQAGKVTREQFDKASQERFAMRDVNKDGTLTRDEMGRGGRRFMRGKHGGRGHRGHGRGHHGRGSGGMGGSGQAGPDRQ